MKVQILRDSEGDVIASFERTPEAIVSVAAEVSSDQKLEEVEAPDNYASDIDSFYQSYRKPKKIQILRDSKGDVIASFERTPEALVSVEAEVASDQKLEEVEAPGDYTSDVDSFYQRYRKSN
jgi:hypothetical protein